MHSPEVHSVEINTKCRCYSCGSGTFLCGIFLGFADACDSEVPVSAILCRDCWRRVINAVEQKHPEWAPLKASK